MAPEPSRMHQDRLDRKEAHEKAVRIRNLRASRLKKSWERIGKEFAVKELLKFVEVEMDRHRKIGNDGIGYDSEGNLVRFTNDQRISSMDRALGIEEISEYLKRHMAA